MAGRPKPTALKLAQGSPRGKAEARNQPTAALLSPDVVPAWLPRKARRHWKTIVAPLANMRVATELDMVLVGRYVTSFAEWLEAQETIEQVGVLVRGRDGNVVRNPAAMLAHQAAARLRAAELELGLSPAARTRFKTDAPDDDEAAWQQLKNSIPARR